MPPTINYQQAYDQTAGVYQPQVDLINSQIADLPNQEQATLSSLDQAKANAFRDITNSSNSRGVLFSGVPIDQQAQYVGTKYLPAVAEAKTATTNAKNTLLGKINDINFQRSQQAQSTVNAAQTVAAKAAAASSKGGITPYQAIQLNNAAAKQYNVKQGSNGQYMFTGANNKPVNLNQFVQGSGGSGQDVLNFLANGTGYDKSVLSKAIKDSAYQKAVANEDYNALTKIIGKYDTGHYYGF